MNTSGVDPTIRRLRGQLIQARRLRDMALLREIEQALVYLGHRQYRCCLVDYSREKVSYYVRLIGYDQSRVKVQIEFPIRPELRSIQWVPLSHLADYSEVVDPGQLRGLRDEVGIFIRDEAVVLARSSPQLPCRNRRSLRRSGRNMRNSVAGNQRLKWLWWYLGGILIASCFLVALMAAG